MFLADVMDELAARIDTITGLRVHAFPPDNVAVPAAIVTYPDDYNYDQTYGRGSDRLTIPVVVMVGKASDRASRDELSLYANGSGLKSIKAVVEGAGVPTFLSLPGPTTGTISTPHRAVFNTGANAIWLAADIAMDDWTPTAIQAFMARWLGLFALKGVLFDLATDGSPRLLSSPNGTTERTFTGTPYGFTNGTRHGVGALLTPDDGAGNRTVQFYTADTLAGPWATHGALVSQAGAESVFNNSQPLAVGAGDQGVLSFALGDVYGAEYRLTGPTGTVLAHADIAPQTPGVPAWIDDDTAYPWSVNGTAVLTAGAGPALYTAFDSARVMSAEFDYVQMAGVDYVAATFNIDVFGDGS